MKTITTCVCAGLLCLPSFILAQTPATVTTANLPAIWKEAGGQKRLLATRFARVQGFRALIERIYGLPITSTTLVYDLVQGNDEIRSSVERSLQGVTELKEPIYFDDGRVEMDCAVAIATVKETLRKETERKKIAGVTITEKEWSDFEYKTIPKVLVETATGALEGSVGAQRIMARRVAELDGYRKLAERMLGVHVTSQTTVKDFVLESDYIKTRVAGLLKGAKKKSVSYDADDNTCKVAMEINMVNVFEVIKTYASKKESGVTKNRIEISEQTEPLTFTETGEGAPRPQDWQKTILDKQNTSEASEPFQETVTIIERFVGQRLVQ